MAKELVDSRRIWWVGAGASFDAGVPTVAPLVARILASLELSRDEVALVRGADLPFESLFEVLLSTSDCTSLLEVFRGRGPALAHHLLAELAGQSLVQTLVTTNFDTLIEAALRERGVPFDLYASDEELEAIDWTASRVRIIKIHGTLGDAQQLAVTIRRVAAKEGVEQRSNAIGRLLEVAADGGVVVVGYSCSDHFDLSPAIRRAARPHLPVWYVAHREATVAPAAAPLRDGHPGNPFRDYDAVSVTCHASKLLAEVWRIVTAEPLPAAAGGRDGWEDHVDRWARELDTGEQPGRRQYVAGMVLKVANAWIRSNDHLTSALAAGLSEETAVKTLLAIGNNHRDLGDEELARQFLSEAHEKAHRGGYLELEARVLNSLGIVAADLGEWDPAIDLYEQCLPLAQRASDRELEGKCRGNIGIALKNRNSEGDLDRALHLQLAALEIAEEIGDMRSEGRTAGNLAVLHSIRGQPDRAKDYYARARRVAELLGDLLHVGIWLHNEGEDNAVVNPEYAESLLERSLAIFTDLGQAAYATNSREMLLQVRSRIQSSHAGGEADHRYDRHHDSDVS